MGALLNIVVHRDVAHFRSGESIGAEELETYARDQGVQVGEGDILLFRTGWLENYSVDLAMDFWKSNPGLGASAAE